MVSNGVGNVSWQNLTIPIPDDVGDVQFPTNYNYNKYFRVYLGDNESIDLISDLITNRTVRWNDTYKRFEVDAKNGASGIQNGSQIEIASGTSNNPEDLLEAVKKVKRFILYKRDRDSGQLEVTRYITITNASQWEYGWYKGSATVSIDGDYTQVTKGTTEPELPLYENPAYLLVPKSS